MLTTGTYAIQTKTNGHFLTAVDGGGYGDFGADTGPGAIHTDATVAQAWEQFTAVELANGYYALKTSDGTHFVSATNGGGMGGPNNGESAIHTDDAAIGPNELFTITPISVNPTVVTIQTNGGPNQFYLTAVNGGGMPNQAGVSPAAITTQPTQPLDWESFRFLPAYSQMTFSVMTGGDDARTDSAVYAQLYGPDPGNNANTIQLLSFTLKPGGAPAWANWTSNDAAFNLNPPVCQAQFTELVLTLEQHPQGLEGWDNWDIAGVTIALDNPGSAAGPITMFTVGSFVPNAPQLARLTRDNPTVTFPL